MELKRIGVVFMLYVAYGSNMNLEQMSYRCPNSSIVGTGKLHGWKIVFNVHADIVETDNMNDKLPVVIWDIANEDWHYLDMYEGYPSYYIKKYVEVEFENGESDIAVVYIMADNRKGICPPAETYFNGIIRGCIDNKIDVEYLYDALEHSYENETEYNQYNTRENAYGRF